MYQRKYFGPGWGKEIIYFKCWHSGTQVVIIMSIPNKSIERMLTLNLLILIHRSNLIILFLTHFKLPEMGKLAIAPLLKQ